METAAAQPEQPPVSTQAGPRPLGQKPFRVVSFPGAGFDTVMQMGVVHALLVTRRKAPDMVSGISVGAITAAAMGEVFHASAGEIGSAQKDEEVRVARFSELLEAFRNAPSTVMKGFFPDPLETNAAYALKPVELPRHFKEERDSRAESAASRTGVIRLFNHLIKLHVSVKVFTQLTRIVMGWNAGSETGGFSSIISRGRLLARLWWIVAANIFALSTPVSLVARVSLLGALGLSGRTRSNGVEAGHIIFRRWEWIRRVQEMVAWLVLGLLPLLLTLATIPAVVAWVLHTLFSMPVPSELAISGLKMLEVTLAVSTALFAWAYLLCRKGVFRAFLKQYNIFSDLGDSHALKEVLVQNFDPSYYGEFRFDDSVRRALKHQRPSTGGCSRKKPLHLYSDVRHRRDGMIVMPLAANLATGKIETFPPDTSVVDALMCACAVVPFFRAQTMKHGGGTTTYIDGINVSNDPIMPVVEHACDILTSHGDNRWDHLRIMSVPLVPLREGKFECDSEPYTGLVDVAIRAQYLQRFQDTLLDKGLVDRISRAVGGSTTVVRTSTGQSETYIPAKVRLVVPDEAHQLSLRIMHAGSVAERRDLINMAVADGCRATIERLVTDAMPDTRTMDERRFLQEPEEEYPDEWPHRDARQTTRLKDAVDRLRRERQTITGPDGAEYVPCRKLLEAWGGLTGLPGSDPVEPTNRTPGPGISEVCRSCIACRSKSGTEATKAAELRQHVRLPRVEKEAHRPDPAPVEEIKGPAVVFLFSGGVFRGVFQVGFSNAASELGIQPDVVAGASVGTIIGALTGRVFEKPKGYFLLERQRQMRRLAATFLTIDRFVLTDRFADFVRHFSIHAASANFSPRDLDLVFRRYETDNAFSFGRRARRVFSGLERLFYMSPFEVMELAQMLRAGHWQMAAKLLKRLAQHMVDRYGVGLELLGSEPLQQLIDGFVFDSKSPPGTMLTHFGFPLMGTATNLTLGKLDILRHTHPWDPRFTQSLLASSAFPTVFRPRWSWEVYRHPEHVAQYADGGIMDNLPLGAVVDYLWGKDSAKRYERRPHVPHLILTATLEPEKADWSKRRDLDRLCWTEVRARATQLNYNGKIDKFQQGQRDIRRILQQRAAEGDPDVFSPDMPLNLDVVAVKPQWLCGSFAFHPMLGFSRKKQTESIAHGCASTICTVADHFDPNNQAHAIDSNALRQWALGRGIALDQLPERVHRDARGPLAYGPAALSTNEQNHGCCWFRKPDPKTGRRPICPFHPKSPASTEGDQVSPELHRIYLACGRRSTHMPRSS